MPSTSKQQKDSPSADDPQPEPPGLPPAPKRLNINLPKALYGDLQAIAVESQRSITDVVRDALSLLSIVHAEEKRGNRLVVINENDELLKELVRVR